MKILIISDAWTPQINGVVRTLEMTARHLGRMGHDVRVTGPDAARLTAVALPFYPEIKIEFFAHKRIAAIIRDWNPDFIHIATEGPLGWAARSVCLRRSLPFTTSYHTRFPEYIAARAPRFLRPFISFFCYAGLRRFHTPAGAVMVATPSMEQELKKRRFHRLARWSRGVDMDLFCVRRDAPDIYASLPRPILLYVGRVAAEKNLRAFLDLDTPGSKIVIGDGPDFDALRRAYPAAHFLGTMQGENLARHYAGADLFVFPSLTDTFGLVLLEACASGLRVAACPAPGPRDIFADPAARVFAVLDADLQRAVTTALALPSNPAAPRAFADHFSWEACTQQFYRNLQAPSPRAKKRLARWRRTIGDGM
ncbi:MAG: glycosyltransferase family 1 protein [Alphaproteobacteria bacterium]|nr:glycosyltransferase family 1 protein [Alphaproteobacteria bacterium]